MNVTQRAVGVGLIGIALWIGGCARTATGPSLLPPVSQRPERPAPWLPALGPEAALREGYDSYARGDAGRAVEQLSTAAAHCSELCDYALFYLGAAERDLGRLNEAHQAFERLRASYPESVFHDRAQLELAKIALKTGRPDEASALAAGLTAAGDPEVAQQGRLCLARARFALKDLGGAYAEAQALRRRYPQSPADRDARALADSILKLNPGLVATNSVEYHRGEAALALLEGRRDAASAEVKAALELFPARSVRAQLLWLSALASRGQPQLERRALFGYLALAPEGPRAASALDRLGRLYWREGDTEQARVAFGRLARRFPGSALVPEAMLAIGLTWEDDRRFLVARAHYQRLIERYPNSEAAGEARFRASWMLFMTAHYNDAARGFAAERAHASSPSQRDRFSYWWARSLEKSGQRALAREVLRQLAQSVDSNYYPELASRKLGGVEPVNFPAASAAEPANRMPPITADRAVEPALSFHLSRALALRSLGLRALEPAELRELAVGTPPNTELRDFVLAEFQAADAWHDAIVTAMRWARTGEMAPESAERVRYPWAFPQLIDGAARSTGVDPYLLLALTRQESLFDPRARSVADARGLMQLLPSTAERVAPRAGLAGASFDLYEPAVSIRLGASYLKMLLDMFGGDEFKAVAAYNGGEDAVRGWSAKFAGEDDEWVENVGYRETREYVKAVIGGLREYRLIYRGHPSSTQRALRRSPVSTLVKISPT